MKAKMMGKMDEYNAIQAQIESAKASGSNQPMPTARPPPPPRQQPQQQQQRDENRRKTVEIVIPAATAGIIIGKGGATIDALQKESGARIRMPNNDNNNKSGGGGGAEGDGVGPDERLVLITGSEDEISNAQRLIESRLSEHENREAKLGGKALKQQMKKRERQASKPVVEYEEVPVFDKATGQLVVKRVKVERSREEEEEAEIQRLNDGDDDGDDKASTKRPKRVQRYEDGERTHFLRGDANESSLNDLVAQERRGNSGVGSMDHNLADAIKKSKRFKGISADDEYDYDDGVEMSDAKSNRQSDSRRQNREKAAQGQADRKAFTAQERADQRFSKHRHLIVSIANHTYLRIADVSPLADAHMVIEPIHHVPCLTEAAEEVADEVRNFQKCVIRMLEARGQHAVFLEQHYAPGGRGAAEVLQGAAAAAQFGSKSSMRIECVPLTSRDGNAAPAYFRKAILESGEEWSQHRKLHELKNGTVRLTVPSGFSYFCVSFGIASGYATVIEDTDSWPNDFGRDVLEGILEHEDSGIPLARRKAEPFERLQQRVVAVTKAFAPYDWTKQM